MSTVGDAAAAIRSAVKDAGRGLVERESLVELVALAAVAGEHLLVIGPPGTAKSEAVRRVAQALGGRYFEYLLGRFTEPSEVFGPVDLRKLKDGVVETQTAGMLPEAELAFLDEVFLGSTAILNTLLGLLNERTFRRGHTAVSVPLRLCVGASNALPEDEALAAFADRFLLRVFLQPIGDPQLEDLLAGGWALQSHAPGRVATLEQLDVLTNAARAAELSAVRPLLAQAVRQLRGAGITLSDRRVVKAQKLVAAAATLAGREHPTAADLWPIVFAVPTEPAQRLARDVLRDTLAAAKSSTLGAAAEEASLGPAARAARLLASAAATLDARPAAEDAGALTGWKLKLEGIAREIDAGFAPGQLPTELAQLRTRLVETVRG